MQRPSRRPVVRVLFLLILAAAPLVACDNDPQPPAPTPVPPTPTVPDRPRAGTLNIRLPQDQRPDGTYWSLNPWFAGFDANAQAVVGLLFSGLTRLDNHLQPQPDLAERWEVSADGTQIVTHLRRDVLWHDGSPFTAQDVVWSYSTLRQVPAYNTAMIHLQEWVQAVEAIDPLTHTVRFTLKGPYAPVLADMSLPVLPSHILSGTEPSALETSSFGENPVGTGPFAFVERRPGQSITLRASDRFYGAGPFVERVVFAVAPDGNVAESAVRDGTLQVAQLPPGSAERLVTEGKGVRGGAFNELGYDYIAFNLRSSHVFSDTRLRQAFAYALDKQRLAFEATGGGADPVWSDVSKASWAYDAAAPQINGNPEQARKLLAEAGWADSNGDGIVERDGKPLAVSLLVRDDNEVRIRAARAMVEPLARVGIGLAVQPVDFQSLLARISPTTNPPFDFELVMLGWTRTSPDPDSFALFHSTQIPTAAAPTLYNIPGFQSPEYDDLAFRARATYDFGSRKEMHARMQAIVADQLPYYFLWAEKFGVVVAPSVRGEIDFSSPNYLWNINLWWVE